MHSEWRVTTNFVGGDKLYAVYRIRDIDDIDHSGNREYATNYMTDRFKAMNIAENLNLIDEIGSDDEIKKYPVCQIKTCPFCGCMSDNTCKIENVAESAPYLILEFEDIIQYCNRPKVFAKSIKTEIEQRKNNKEETR